MASSTPPTPPPGASIGDRLPRYRARFLAWSVVLNLTGRVAPAVAAIVALPVLAYSSTPDVLGPFAMGRAALGCCTLLGLTPACALIRRVAPLVPRLSAFCRQSQPDGGWRHFHPPSPTR